ncbi:MAG: response regulator [Sulfuritalea sp.]|jgi:CheY-like chemotaxis protein|nr:response regulator [Sulfuritalea sp.]
MPINFSSIPSSLLTTLDDSAVLALTKDGEKELREPGTTLAPNHLEVLVLIYGHATVARVLKRAHGTPPDVLRTSLKELINKGFVTILADPASHALDPGDFFTLGAAPTDTPESNAQADADAVANTAFLRQNGYCVNIARRSTVKRERSDGHKLTVLVIDDDPDICSLLRLYLKLEGFDTRTAGNRDEIVAEFRRPPLPDLVLLDVTLTDVNGFDILTKMRLHPVLKGLPVIMLTAEATREGVLRGILGGADGYITKPFQIHPLVRAVKAVLGLKDDPTGQDWDYSF